MFDVLSIIASVSSFTLLLSGMFWLMCRYVIVTRLRKIAYSRIGTIGETCRCALCAGMRMKYLSIRQPKILVDTHG